MVTDDLKNGIRQDAATAASKIYHNGTRFTLNGNSGTAASGLIGPGGSADGL